MRQNLIIALLAVCATLLLVDITLRSGAQEQVAHGQASGSQAGSYVVATGVNQSGANNVCFVLDTASKKLACYSVKTKGIEFLGVRSIAPEFQLNWLNPPNTMLKPEAIQRAVDQAKRQSGGRRR